MSEKDIIKIDLVKNIRVKNIHNDFVFPKQDILKIYFRNNESRIIDLFSNIDITDIEYFEILEDKKTKIKNIFLDKREV